MSAFRRALGYVLAYEGGFVNDPDDPGGATNMGITQATYDAFLDEHGLPHRPVREITDEEVASIYFVRYWERGRCPEMPWPLSLVHFDACVNHGHGGPGATGANQLLQRALEVEDDGILGPLTMGAIQRQEPVALAIRYLWQRLDYYAEICLRRRRMRKFLLAWLTRVLHLRGVALEADE